MADLSPEAKVVLNAYMNNCGWLDGPLERDYHCVAAVLRAAGNHCTHDKLTLYCLAEELEGAGAE